MKNDMINATSMPLSLSRLFAYSLIVSASISMSGCATVDGWFAPEIETKDNQLALVTKSDGAEQEIDPNADENDTELMGDALTQPSGFVMADKPIQNEEQTELNAIGQTQQLTNTGFDNNVDVAVNSGQKQPQNTTQIRRELNQNYRVANTPQAQKNSQKRQATHAKVQGQRHKMQSHKRQIESSVENDYSVFRALNHQFIKNNSAQNQYQSLNKTISHFVMDLVASLSPEHYGAALVVRPMTLKVSDVANPDGGKELITSMLANQMKDYGFNVFDGRKPKGKFSGDEVILETIVDSYGDQFVLYGTLTLLKSNTVASTHNAFISDFFFRNIKDGVEVYPDGSNF